jgi:hypothetical protein
LRRSSRRATVRVPEAAISLLPNRL